MHRLGSSRTILWLLPLVPILVTQAVVAKDGRDFAGHYSLTEVIQRDGGVRVTLTLHMINYSGQNLPKAAIEVHSAQPGAERLGFLPTVYQWPDNQDIVLAADFTVSADEYRQWCRRSPGVFVVYSDGHGDERRAWVQLSRRPVIFNPSGPGSPRLTTGEK